MASANRGRLLEPAITIPPDATDLVISSDGFLSVRQAGSDQLVQLGQIQLARFVNPQGLVQVGENLYSLSDSSGLLLSGTPGSERRGPLRQGFLESSNVELDGELFELRRLESHRCALVFAIELLVPNYFGHR